MFDSFHVETSARTPSNTDRKPWEILDAIEAERIRGAGWEDLRRIAAEAGVYLGTDEMIRRYVIPNITTPAARQGRVSGGR